MSDLISRQDAIDAIERDMWDLIEMKSCIDIIKGVPSAQPKFPEDEICLEGETAAYKEGWNDAIDTYAQRWIPCSERLPEGGSLVLTTIRGTDFICLRNKETFEDAIERTQKMLRASCGFLGEDGWYGSDGYPEIVKPIAWMPLPEPWKGEQNDKRRS